MSQTSEKLGENIKGIGLRGKMSQGDICRSIEMDRSYMSAIEGGKVNVTLVVLERARSSIGRAPALHAGGYRFEAGRVHNLEKVGTHFAENPEN